MVSALPALSRVWQHVKLSDVSLGTRPLYSLVIEEDIKKPTSQIHESPFNPTGERTLLVF